MCCPERLFPSLALCLIALSAVACSGGASNEPAAEEPTGGAMAANMDQRPDAAGAATGMPGDDPGDPSQAATGNQYQLLGIKDPDFGIVAFAMKIPRDWPAKQTFQRQWNGATPMIQSYVVFRSPDATQQIEYLPASQYVYSDGPGANGLRMQKQAVGIDPRMAENEMPPMTAVDYLERHVLPQMAQNGVTLRDLGNPRETAPHRQATPGSDKPHMTSSASVDGVLPNGNRARMEVHIGWNEMRNNQDVYYSWWAAPSIIQTGSGNLENTYAHAETARASMVYNPEWLRKNRDLMEKSDQAATESIRRNHAASMENIAQWGRINQANAAASMARINSNAAASAERQQRQSADFDARMARNDRNNELFTDVVINGDAKYSNPSTGERIKADSRYDHTYSDSAGNYYQSNTPLESNDVNWQEMEKVPFDDY